MLDPSADTLDIDILVLPETNLILVASVIEPLRAANRISGQDLYRWRIFSPDGAPVETRSRIPVSIWGGLFTLALLGMASLGYQAGLAATQRSPAMLGMVLAFAGVLFLIADLDRGREGFLMVSQEAMTDLQRTMQPVKAP